MAAFMDLSFPGQRTTTATSCIPHNSVYMQGPHAGKSKNGFFHCDTWLQIFQNDSKICEAEVTLTPLINKICKPCSSVHEALYLVGCSGIVSFRSQIEHELCPGCSFLGVQFLFSIEHLCPFPPPLVFLLPLPWLVLSQWVRKYVLT